MFKTNNASRFLFHFSSAEETVETTKYCYVNMNKCIIRIVNCTNINDRHLERQLSRRVGYVLVIIFNAEGYLL